MRARAPDTTRVSTKVIAEIRRLGGLRKTLQNKGGGRGRQYAEILLKLMMRSAGSAKPQTRLDREAHPGPGIARRWRRRIDRH